MKNYKVKDKIGQKNIARNGMEMTIVGYRNSHDIDVQFQDGTIVYNKHYKNFKDGFVAHPSKKNKVGETSMSSIGMKMTVINYHDCNNIDIRFEDGTVVYGKTYGSFKNGSIRHPDISPYKSNNFCDHTGETAIANNGMKMTIIAYRNFKDIDIQFEDNVIVTGKRYDNFKLGKIKHPTISSRTDVDGRIGETAIANNGMGMTIVAYRNYQDIDIQFNDGVIVKNMCYGHFKKGTIGHPYITISNTSFPEATILYYLSPIGFKKMNRGYFSKFNSDFGNREIDIFNEKEMIAIEYDGFYFHNTTEAWDNDNDKDAVCEHCPTHPIQMIRIREDGLKPTKSKKTINIMRKKNNSTEELEDVIHKILTVLSTKMKIEQDIDVNIERDYQEIIKLKINHSVIHRKKISDIYSLKRTGETGIAKNGMKITIIAYRNCNDIDVQFEDNTIVYNKNYQNFRNGKIAHPTIHYRIGESRVAKNGMKMTIIGYREYNDIDIQFEDGTVVYNRSYQEFNIGKISYPKSKSRIGETRVAKNGMKMTIINYRNANNIDIRFEDDVVVYNKKYENFKSGKISHPTIHYKVGERGVSKNGMDITIIAYRNRNDIDIKFEDNTIVCHKSYESFRNGIISHPFIHFRVGETSTIKNGMVITIIAYRNFKDIDIRFEDGIIVKNQTYSNFKNGYIKHPSRNKTGEIGVAKNGMSITIINYRNCNDIDVQFEDGTIVCNKSYQYFKNGKITHPTIHYRIGETNINRYNMKMAIVTYRNCNDIDVQFEDGAIIYNKSYRHFKDGILVHPSKFN